jgi:hypothetical protein
MEQQFIMRPVEMFLTHIVKKKKPFPDWCVITKKTKKGFQNVALQREKTVAFIVKLYIMDKRIGRMLNMWKQLCI